MKHWLAFPIARRELLVLSRAGATWKGRFGTSAMVLVFGIGLSLLYHYAGQRAFSPVMHIVGGSLSLMCLFSGVSLTADAIAEEKRAGTIGLLFLTHLSSFEIVIGKLVAHAVLGFYTVLCVLPLLSMSMIFGGMRFRDVLMYVFSALNVLFFSASLGLFTSSVCRDKRRAGALGVLILMFFWMGLPLLALLLPAIGAPGWASATVARFSLNLIGQFGIGLQRFLPSTSATWSVAWTHLLGWAFIGFTVWWLPRSWQDAPNRKRRGLREVWRAISHGSTRTRAKLRRKLLDRNPFMWLASRDRFQTAAIWIVTVSLLAVFGFHFLRGTLPPEFVIAVPISLSFVLQLVFSGAAGAQIYREYDQGTLEMVLSTPLGVHAVIHGQLAAAFRRYRLLFALLFILLWVGVILIYLKAGPRQWIAIAAFAVYSGLAALQFYSVGWVGMWALVTAPDPKKAHANGFFFITIFPSLMFGLIVASVQFLSWLTGIRFSPPGEVVLPLLFILAFSNCIYWLRRAKRELPERLRVFAYRRYSEPEQQTIFGRLGRVVGRWMHRAKPRPVLT